MRPWTSSCVHVNCRSFQQPVGPFVVVQGIRKTDMALSTPINFVMPIQSASSTRVSGRCWRNRRKEVPPVGC